MTIRRQRIFPAARKIKDLETLLDFPFEYIVLLDTRIGELNALVDLARKRNKHILLHSDLVEGLKNDEYAADYLCRHVRPAGLISTRASVIQKAKQNGVTAIQRVFLIDSGALEKSFVLLERTKPDFIEVLPGILPDMIREMHERTGIPILAGGLIRSVEDVEKALSAGAVAVTTSNKDLWRHYADFV